jgi:hypothetical protein
METQRSVRAGGGFRWNAGAWFGAQIGSTLWLVVLGTALSFYGDSSAGTAIIALAVAANGIGLILWEHRDRIRPYPAVQTLIAVAGCSAFVAFALLDGTSAWGLACTQAGGGRPPYAVLLIFPAMMVLFALQEHAARRARGRDSGDAVADGRGRS